MRCAACGAHLVWATNAKTGRKMPLDRDASDRGNVWLRKTGFAEVLGKQAAEEARRQGEKLYTSHFATCPRAAEFRR